MFLSRRIVGITNQSHGNLCKSCNPGQRASQGSTLAAFSINHFMKNGCAEIHRIHSDVLGVWYGACNVVVSESKSPHKQRAAEGCVNGGATRENAGCWRAFGIRQVALERAICLTSVLERTEPYPDLGED